MPRTYKPTNGSRTYRKYDEEVMIAALREYENTNTSFAEIEKRFGIPKSVLHRHYKRVLKKPGGQTVLNEAEENYIIDYLNVCSEWGYPLDTYDLRVLVKGYLDRIGMHVKRFNNNLPGPDFVNRFLRRHKDKISKRISQNIKRTRASVSIEIIQEYFQELEKSLEDVPLGNLVNYDETNLSDDPGKRKVITKRGVKYPERIMNHSKTSTSLMMAAAADGTLLSCYVVYKSQHLYESWVQHGPEDCRYNRTSSGWFDAVTFDDWVHTVAFPYFENKTGKKILIGDNLSSHLSINLIRECKEKGIDFVFLPANSTHLTQPLDVAFFRPTKFAWRDILFNWKKSEGRNLTTIPKSCFPTLLKKLWIRLSSTAKDNILAGFEKAGISPVDKNKVLERLPGNTCRLDESFSKEAIDATVITMLKEMRYSSKEVKVSNKRKKIDVIPGQSVITDTENADTETADSEIGDRDIDNSDVGNTSGLNEKNEQESTNEKRYTGIVTVSPQLYENFNPRSDTGDINLDCATNNVKTANKRKKTEDVAAGPNTMMRLIKKAKTDKTKADRSFKVSGVKAGPNAEKPKTYKIKSCNENNSQESSNETIKKDEDVIVKNLDSFLSRKKSVQNTETKNIAYQDHAYVKPATAQILVTENEDIIFKKPNIPHSLLRNATSKTKSLRDDAWNQNTGEQLHITDTNDVEFSVKNVDRNVDSNLVDDLDVNKMPILFDDNLFWIDNEIEVEDLEEKKENQELRNKKLKNNNKVQIIENEELKSQVEIDVKRMRKVSLHHPINRKSVVKYYKNDLEILNDLMDDNVN